MVQDLTSGDWVLHRIAPVDVETVQDERFFLRFQESVGPVGEVDDEKEAPDADPTGDAALDDHDPCVQRSVYSA